MDNFNRCKLCGEIAAQPTYNLADAIIYVCRKCDFHFLNQLDAIDSEEKNQTGLTAKARQYIDSRIGESASLLPKRLKMMRKFIRLPGIQCLDIGAGVGQFLNLLEHKKAHGVGIEPSNLRREYAREKLAVDLRKELVDDHYWQENFVDFFDAICLWDVIEHVNFPVETCAAAVKLLKPGGYLFLDTPDRETLPYRMSQRAYRLSRGKFTFFFPNFYSTAPYGHKQIFTTDQLTGLLKKTGLKIQRVRHTYRLGIFRGDKIILVAQKPR
ncbi:MAG: methyltransferase domain-containing protein [Desulfuromonadaceae bacterium]|nr:methyltransferase domain-containing protein [Desulfuromonadaceae bacterium]